MIDRRSGSRLRPAMNIPALPKARTTARPFVGDMPWGDACAAAALVLAAIALFRAHVFGDGLYIGNPDRLNSNLKILKFYVDGLSRGHLDAWSDFEMLGYDTFTMPYTFPNILTFLTYLLGPSKLYLTAGYESVGLLALAGISAYAFIRAMTGAAFASAVGAVLYEFSSLTVLKVSQNDMSFAVFIVIPVLMLLVWNTRSSNATKTFVLLVTILFLLLHFMFLQKASYALILSGSYALYRSILKRDWRIFAVFAAAVLVATVAAAPRIAGIALALREYGRSVAGLDFSHFEDLYKFQAIYPTQFLRWFDVTIYGRFPSDGTITMRNNINLTEGFLLYTSSLVPFLLLFGVVWYRGSFLRLPFSTRNDSGFLLWFMVFTFSVVVFPPVLRIVYLLYMRMDFTHARILIVGLLPLSTLLALVLVDLSPKDWPSGRALCVAVLAGILLALAVAFGLEAFAQSFKVVATKHIGESDWNIRESAVVRIAASGLCVAALLVGLKSAARKPAVAAALYVGLAVSVALHTFLGADFQVNGKQTRATPPFLAGDNYYAGKADFRPPDEASVAALSRRLDNDHYRTVLVCDAKVAGGFCAGHIPEFWRLRVVDGYYGLGVPKRLGALPWQIGYGLRTISYTNPDHLYWPILSLLNVKYALFVNGQFYRNNAGTRQDWQPASVGDLVVRENPLPAVPRAFFARSTLPVATPEAAAEAMFPEGRLADVTKTSFVEGMAQGTQYLDEGKIALAGSGDRLEAAVDAATADRFLVLNELYFPGWSATVDGNAVPIFATNAVMRGVVVPAGATKIVFTYTPFVRRPIALGFYGAGLLLFIVGVLVFARLVKYSIGEPRSAPG